MTEINLVDPNGAIPLERGPTIVQPTWNLPADHIRINQTYDMVLHSSDHDDAADRLRNLFTLFRQSKNYHTKRREDLPVYLEEQTANESNSRYAIVYDIPWIEIPDVLDVPFDVGTTLERWRIQMVRGIWQSSIPADQTPGVSITKSDGPADDTQVFIANHVDADDISYIYRADSDGTFSSNLATDSQWALWDAGTTDNWLYIGSTDGALNHVILDIETAADVDATIVVQAYDTDAWRTLTFGTEFTTHPTGPSTNLFNTADEWAINISYIPNWTQNTINSDAAYWLRLGMEDVSTWTTTPATSTNEAYSQRKSHIELSSNVLKGDIPPYLQFRFSAPYGSFTSNATMGTVSRVFMGAKTRNLDGFSSHLNCGGYGNTSDWTVSYDTDTYNSDWTPSTPGGFKAVCYFTTEKTLVPRVTFAGANKLDDYVGEYRVITRVQQAGGSEGDISVQVRASIGDTDIFSPQWTSEEVTLSAKDSGWEIVDLGRLALPFTDIADTDVTEANLYFEILAAISTGSSWLQFSDLILIPIDEWSCVIDDPLTDLDKGSSALRGDTLLDLDFGVIQNRTIKYIKSGNDYIPSETWYRHGKPWSVEPDRTAKIYFLLGHYRETYGWGSTPMLSSIGQMLGIEVRQKALYLSLRGSD
jgi:hypothetical protein